MEQSFKTKTVCLNTFCGNMYLCILFDSNDKLVKLIPYYGKSGVCAQVFLSSICELLSALLKDQKLALPALTSLVGHSCNAGTSCVDVLSRYVLNTYLKGGENNNEEAKG